MQTEYYGQYLQDIQAKLNNPWSLHGIHHRHLNDFIQLTVKKLPVGAKVLDGGCGFSIWLTPEIESRIEYFGVDCEQEAIAFCKNHFRDRIYQLADLSTLPFPSQYFDAVVMREVIEHIRVPGESLSEVKRVLKPGGYFIMTTPNYGSFLLWLVENIYNRFFSSFKPYLEDIHPSKFTNPTLIQALESHLQLSSLGTVDLGINLAAVCINPLSGT